MNEFKVAYICNGLKPECSGKLGCFKHLKPVFDEEIVCRHTTDINYAINDPCENPEDFVPSRFKKFVDQNGEIKYFEDFS